MAIAHELKPSEGEAYLVRLDCNLLSSRSQLWSLNRLFLTLSPSPLD